MIPKERYDATELGARLLREKRTDAQVDRLITKALEHIGLSKEQFVEQASKAGIYIDDPSLTGCDIPVGVLAEILNLSDMSLEIGWNPVPPYREPYYLEGGPSLGLWIKRDWGVLRKPADRVSIHAEFSDTKYWYERTDRTWFSEDGTERTVFVWTGEECDN